ncbi:ATP-grasp domain-containing protein, partial [Alicyclobacillus suci]|uniref:ATP-grasp domain-containing protein n=1 Tax=Alicyclobacillus suci TaxID=2816080 RepID=UPI0034DD3F47
MTKILIVTTHTDIEQRIENMLNKGVLPDAEYSVVAEFFESVPPSSPVLKNFFAIDDLRNRDEITASIIKCEEWGPFDYVLQTDEYAVYLAAEIREYLKVPGLCTADVIKFRDKVLMKKALNGQVRAPRVYGSKDLFENRDLFPIVAKPRSYAGSKGVSILSSKEDLHEYLQANDVIMDDAIESFHEFSMNEVEFEEYVEGSIFHVDGLIFDNEIIFCRASQYLGKLLNYLKGEPVGSVIKSKMLCKIPSSECVASCSQSTQRLMGVTFLL